MRKRTTRSRVLPFQRKMKKMKKTLFSAGVA
jgi:hypothetical protein